MVNKSSIPTDERLERLQKGEENIGLINLAFAYGRYLFISSTYWQMGAAWLCLHIFEHYRYTGDMDFPKEYLPIIKEAALFFEDTLIENDKGQLVVSPSTSPENPYLLPNGERGNMCEGA